MLSRVTLKFDGWPWKTRGHLFYATSSFVQPLVNSNWSYSPETPNLGQIRRFLEPCDLEIWWIALQYNRAPLLCYFKLYASFWSYWCIFSLQMQKIEYHHFAQVEVDFGQVHMVWWLSYCQVGEKISVEPCPGIISLCLLQLHWAPLN